MIDLNEVNDSQQFPLSEEERLINESKPLAFNAIKIWIENVSKKSFLYPNDFRKSLADGILLCNLLNCLKPGSIKRINKISTAIAGYDNIGKFLQCCEEDFGLSTLILFKTSDLEDLTEKFPSSQLESDKRLERVLICLFHLAKSVENHLTTFAIDSAPFSLLLKSQDFREMKKLKSNSISDDAVFDSPVPEIIQKQIPNYLANKAQETLQLTKANQDNLNKSLESDDWQESLENWRERRRQALSQSLVENISTDAGNVDSKDLIKLKEKARQMKQLRDQIKDQNIQQCLEPSATQQSAPIASIDEETKAMIEKLKQKKLAEEQKRKYSISSPTITSFASDSELSNSLAVDKPEEDVHTTEDEKKANLPYTVSDHIPLNNDIDKAASISATDGINQISKPLENDKTRIIQVKLSQRLKQDSNQLWGMELTERYGKILVSKVKIGSSSDVCEVKKNDEIVSINSKEVTNQSIDYVKSLFQKYASVISSSDYITLSLRRLINEDPYEEDDEEFLSENISDSDDQPIVKTEKLERKQDIVHLSKSHINPTNSNIENMANLNESIIDINKDKNKNISKENLHSQKANESQTISKTVEKMPNYKDDTSFLEIDISTVRSEVPNLSEKQKSINQTESNLRSSVQEKIAKFESQKILNPPILSSSWNVSKNSPDDSSFINRKYHHQTSCPWLPSNPDCPISKPTSNTHSYLDTETPKLLSSSNQKPLFKTTPIVQNSINSSTGTSQNGSTMDLDAPEDQSFIPNINNAYSLKRVPSGNSSTSDDVSALNETIIMPQYLNKGKPINSISQGGDRTSISNEDSHGVNCVTKKSPIVNSVKQTLPVSTHSKYSMPLNNVSTGIQANLQNREPPIYTTITTSFENANNKRSCAKSKISDDDSYSVSLPKFTESDVVKKNIPKQHSYPQFLWQKPTNKNDISKELTTITSVYDESENKNQSEKSLSMSSGSNITGASEDNERSVEIEVSITPQLFPMRNKTLFARSTEEKNFKHKSNDSITLERSFDDDENTLKSDYIRVTNLDDVVSPIREKTNTSFGIDNIVVSSLKDEVIVPTTVKTKQFSYPSNSKEPERHKVYKISQRPKSECYEVLESNIDMEPSISTVPAPTLFKGGQKSDNTLSSTVSYSKSDNIYAPRSDSTFSTRKPIKKNNLKTSDGLNSKRSSSTKDLSYLERLNSNDKTKSSTGNRDNSLRSLSNHRKQSASQVTFSNIVQDITETKSQIKTVSIEKISKTAPVPVREKKKSKSQNRKSCPAEISTKCNNCSQPAGSEDLMVIEELNLHFHLRCFICSECKVQLGDGKSDTDVRIRRSKLHCTVCYNKKSSKSKHRNSFPTHPNQTTLSNNIQTKGGHGDGENMNIRPGATNSKCAFSTAMASLPNSPFLIADQHYLS